MQPASELFGGGAAPAEPASALFGGAAADASVPPASDLFGGAAPASQEDTGSLGVANGSAAALPAAESQPAVAEAESPWITDYTPEGYRYWYNTATGESSWYPPEGEQSAAAAPGAAEPTGVGEVASGEAGGGEADGGMAPATGGLAGKEETLDELDDLFSTASQGPHADRGHAQWWRVGAIRAPPSAQEPSRPIYPP